MTPMLRKGQRARPLHPQLAEREWGVRGDAVCDVLCSYHVYADPSGSNRVDVRFASGPIVWGAPANEFVVVAEERAERH